MLLKLVFYRYSLYFPINETDYQSEPISEIELKSGGIYIATVYQNTNFTVRFFNIFSIYFKYDTVRNLCKMRKHYLTR